MIDEKREGGCLQRSKPNARARESDRNSMQKKPSEGHRDKSESAFAVVKTAPNHSHNE
ncbi:hypothetical protein [Klebsiella pneumoniae ISC21]|nr:hypothetical protein [Klebsiella pneumoniae ISC21]